MCCDIYLNEWMNERTYNRSIQVVYSVWAHERMTERLKYNGYEITCGESCGGMIM